MADRILIIAAHPDDEVLGCGGTVALYAKRGWEIHALIMCEGESLRYGEIGVGQDKDIQKSAQVLGIKQIHQSKYPDQRMEEFTLLEQIQSIERVIEEIQPKIVFTQSGVDSNQDHKRVFDAAIVATRPTQKCIEAVYSYYVPSSSEWGYPRNFVPDTWVDIKDTLETKIRAFKCYESEVKEYPHPRSIRAIENLAYYTGNQCCMEAAEAFVTIRRIVK